MGNVNDNDEYERICYICRRPESRAGKMVVMPGNLQVCPDCLQKAFDTVNNTDLNNLDFMSMDPTMFFGGFPGATNFAQTSNSNNNSTTDENHKNIENEDNKNTDSSKCNDNPKCHESPICFDDTKTDENKADGANKKGNYPNVSFINLSDLQGFGRPQPKLKKRSKEKKPAID